ncbi:hypothetical protein HPB51_012130 [Rhipicephalus microplus]|uniref:Uncharacterized protein n=1 Tax=Rhipicephalus microplus TaxID=6941 RepID=A0A9J6DVQ6_RHIMP|nr:hypothetical protein HPB51_012130 [Rhipicephalus microplus]
MACVAEVVRQELRRAFSLPELPSDQRSVSYASAVRRHTPVSYNSSPLAYRDVSQGPYNEPWAPAPNPPQPYPQPNVPMQTAPLYTPPTSASWSQATMLSLSAYLGFSPLTSSPQQPTIAKLLNVPAHKSSRRLKNKAVPTGQPLRTNAALA